MWVTSLAVCRPENAATPSRQPRRWPPTPKTPNATISQRTAADLFGLERIDCHIVNSGRCVGRHQAFVQRDGLGHRILVAEAGRDAFTSRGTQTLPEFGIAIQALDGIRQGLAVLHGDDDAALPV